MADLDEFVKSWAWAFFVRTRSSCHAHLEQEDVGLEIDWSKVRFLCSTPEYSQGRFTERPPSQVALRSIYENRTDHEQVHSLESKRKTIACCTTTVTKGFVKCRHLEIKLGIPNDVLSETTIFGREVILASSESTRKELIPWCTSSSFIVRPHSRTLAELVLYEKEYSAKFKLSIRILGPVIVVVTNLQDNSCIHTLKGSMREIIRQQNVDLDETVLIQGHKVTWQLQGQCQFRFGAEQRLQLLDLP